MTTTTWNPIEQLESLADELTEWTRSRDRLTTAEISVIYRQHSTEKLRRWLESNVSQDEADGFHRFLHEPLTNLTRWEQQTKSGTWWQSEDDADDAYRSEMELLERYVEQLRLLAGRIKPKPSVPPLSDRPTNLPRETAITIPAAAPATLSDETDAEILNVLDDKAPVALSCPGIEKFISLDRGTILRRLRGMERGGFAVKVKKCWTITDKGRAAIGLD